MKRVVLLVILSFILLLSGSVIAAAGGNSVSWSAFTGGGGLSTGEQYSLDGTMGQAVAHGQMTGGELTLESGFWNIKNTATTVPTRVPGLTVWGLWLLAILLLFLSGVLFYRDRRRKRVIVR